MSSPAPYTTIEEIKHVHDDFNAYVHEVAHVFDQPFSDWINVFRIIFDHIPDNVVDWCVKHGQRLNEYEQNAPFLFPHVKKLVVYMNKVLSAMDPLAKSGMSSHLSIPMNSSHARFLQPGNRFFTTKKVICQVHENNVEDKRVVTSDKVNVPYTDITHAFADLIKQDEYEVGDIVILSPDDITIVKEVVDAGRSYTHGAWDLFIFQEDIKGKVDKFL